MKKELIFGSQKVNVVYTERCAAYAVITDNGKLAAVKLREKYFLPGGGSLPGETAEQTVIREVLEELARKLRLVHKIGEVIQYFYSESDLQHYKMHATFFAAEFIGKSGGNGEDKLFWLSRAEAEGAFYHECHLWATGQI